MGSSVSGLTALQRRVLDEFFSREQAFVLTGGGALVGFHLRHRVTSDLDLFTRDRDAMERGKRALSELATALGAVLRAVNESPTFFRGVLDAAEESLIVDLVTDTSFQVRPDKDRVGNIVMDPPEEILANKLTTLVGRQEERDLVDVYFLERSGLRVEDHLGAAFQKDGGCTPATLAWLLSTFPLPAAGRLPAGVTVEELGAWRDELVARLRRAALPGPSMP